MMSCVLKGQMSSMKEIIYWASIVTLDSACSHHYTSHRNCFPTYDDKEGGTVVLGDNSTCQVAGIESVRIRMHDSMVRTLSNVKHVLNLKKNLISLGYLEKEGFSFKAHAHSGLLTVTKGSMLKMRGRRLSNNLYTLDSSVVEPNYDSEFSMCIIRIMTRNCGMQGLPILVTINSLSLSSWKKSRP